MSQGYKSYHFYTATGSDSEEEEKKGPVLSKAAKKQEQKKNNKNQKTKPLDSDESEEETKRPTKDISDDSENEYTSAPQKKVKTEDLSKQKKSSSTKNKISEAEDTITPNNTPNISDQQLNSSKAKLTENMNKGIRDIQGSTPNLQIDNNRPIESSNQELDLTQTQPLVMNALQNLSENLKQQTSAEKSSRIGLSFQKTEVISVSGSNNAVPAISQEVPNSDLNKKDSKPQGNNTVLGYTIETEPVSNPNLSVPVQSSQMVTEPESQINVKDADLSSPITTNITNTKITQPIRNITFDPSTLMQIPKKLPEKDSKQSKKKSGRYQESSSSRSSSPSPPKASSKPIASAESRKKSSLSSHLKALKEKAKNPQPDEGYDSEEEEGNKDNKSLKTDKPLFFIDTNPLGVIEEEGETKKLVPQTTELDQVERQYRIIGFERAFKTQEKNLLDKLDKFLIAREEDIQEKKEEEQNQEEPLNDEADEFTFESRYFMYNPTKVCNRCKKPGHFERWCPEDVIVKCLFCVGPHRTDSCTQVVCFHCYGVGHRARDCDAPGSLVCFRCGKRGHKSSNCGIIVLKDSVISKEKRDESGDIKCMKCGRYGHAKCTRDIKEQAHTKQHAAWVDGLYGDLRESKKEIEKEDINLKVLSKANEVESMEFKAALSDDSYEDLGNFKSRSRSKPKEVSKKQMNKEKYREKEKEKFKNKKKSKRY